MLRRNVVVAAVLCAGCAWPFGPRHQYQPKPSRRVEELREAIVERVSDVQARDVLLAKLDHVRRQYERDDKQRHDLKQQVDQLSFRLARLQRFQPVMIELHPLTGLHDVNSDGQPDELEVHVRTLDRQGDDVLKTKGVFSFQLQRVTGWGLRKRTRVLDRWRCQAGGKVSDNPSRVFNHHVFRLAIRNPIGDPEGLFVTASLHSDEGDPLKAERPLTREQSDPE